MSNQENKNNRVSPLEQAGILITQYWHNLRKNYHDLSHSKLGQFLYPQSASEVALMAASGPIVKSVKAISVPIVKSSKVMEPIETVAKKYKSHYTKAEIKANNAKIKQKLQELQADPNFTKMDIGVRTNSDGWQYLIGPEGVIDIKRLGGKLSNSVAQVLKIRNNK